ncbi:MAG: aminotransferase class V-fold PLP-dependent enzyme [Bryobacterales bacterium]|nr:aminotransferase class V-fold PLP-dependent enzyme [Bryobacterales bacterium]MDE0293624.1 aminotransferase class V-fold PLP-dependent enzyme [Bryobacterales bacterium]
MNRRRFLSAAAALSAASPAASAAAKEVDFEAVRADFPRARTAAYFDCASSHPLSVHSTAALHRYVDWVAHQVGAPWWPSWAPPRGEAKNLFARLVNAKPSEIAFARSTIEAESNLLNGMAHVLSQGNVVTNDLHYTAALYNYKMRQQEGLDLRVVKNRDWRIDIDDMRKAIDAGTKLVSITLVSNVNGYLSDVKLISDLAHSQGAYLYVDVIQAAGAVPIDVRAMGIDFAACSTYKWLMGVKGFGFLYVREDLQRKIVKPTQHSGGVRFNYEPWVDRPDAALDEITFRPRPGPGCYEVSYPSYEGVICAQESLNYILQLGVPNIRKHVRGLTNRLQEELPKLGYPSITPKGNESPIVVFEASDPSSTVKKLQAAGVHVAMRFGNKMRLSPSVFSNHEDVDKLLGALA